jgi:hypothetical protein
MAATSGVAALGNEKRRGKGPGGPGAHQEAAGGLGLAGGWPVATNFGGDDVGTCRETAAIALTPALLGSIRLAGRKREVWQSFPASQWSSGQLLAAAEDDGHGGVLSVCEVVHGRERERE